MKKIKLLVCMMSFLFFCPNVMASEINHFVSKADNELIMDKTYNSSVAVAGDKISITGTVKGLSAMAGNKVTLDGETDYGVLAGNTVDLNGLINKDVFIAGNVITTKDEANFKRDVIITGNDIELNGNFERNISVYGATVNLKNINVKGNVKIYAGSVEVQKTAVINGTLYYPEDSKYKASKEAVIGNVKKTEAIKTEDEENYLSTISAKVWNFLGLALIFAALSLFFPNIFNNINEKYEKFDFSEGLEVFTKGLVFLILVPVVAILFIFTMIGMPLSIILLLIYGICIYLSTIFTAYLIGYKIWQKVFDKDAHILFFGLIGLFVILLFELIPGVRFFVSMVVLLVGLGLVIEIIKKQ